MGGCIEEEELGERVSLGLRLGGGGKYLGDDEGLDEHDDAAGYHGREGDDVDHAEDVEDDVAWTGQMFC